MNLQEVLKLSFPQSIAELQEGMEFRVVSMSEAFKRSSYFRTGDIATLKMVDNALSWHDGSKYIGAITSGSKLEGQIFTFANRAYYMELELL